MKSLLKKELLLSMHPTAPIFLLLSAMLLIPNYPYYVVFFYTSLAVFFTCLLGRENNDIFYSMTLPIERKDLVKARFWFVILLEMLQMVVAIPFAVLRGILNSMPNEAGMEANLALFGVSFALLGIFNDVFLTFYYQNPQKVGKAFILSSVAVFVLIGIAETCTYVVPFVRDRLDTADPAYCLEKLTVLGVGILLYCLLTLSAYRKSVRAFERQDL